jgi:hypothetical protein
MALVISDSGIFEFMEQLRNTWNGIVYTIHLFKNNLIPTRNSVLADFTECDFDGYAAQPLGAWGLTIVTAHVGVTQSPINTFTKAVGATSNNVYGYYVTDPGVTQLLWSERDINAPFLVSIAGQTYSVQPFMSDQNLPGVP